MGYTSLRHFHGGLSIWIEAGEPVERGRPPLREPASPPALPVMPPSSREESGGLVPPVARRSTPPPVARLSTPPPVARLSTRPARGGWTARVIEGIAATSFGRLLGVWIAVVAA